MVSAPFKLSNLLLPSVTHTRIADIVFLFTGLNVILRDSMVKLYDGCSTLGLKLYMISESLQSTRLPLTKSQWIFKIPVSWDRLVL